MESTPRNNIKEAGNGETVKTSTFNHDKEFIHTLSYASKMAAVDIEFNDVTYAIPSSRKGKRNHTNFKINKLK